MHCLPLRSLIPMLVLVSQRGSAQNFVDLDFTHNVQPNNAIYPNQSTLGPDYFNGTVLDFVNVAFVNGMAVDARVSINLVSPGYEFVGYIPDYNQAPAGPEGDLGVYYRFNGDNANPTGGISYTISFYESGSNFTTARTLTDFRFLIYDLDGEPGQSESIHTHVADGFTGYQIRNGSGIQTQAESDSLTFHSRGIGHPEDNADGGLIAYYQNTSQVTFDMFSTSAPGLPFANYGIFAAYDGDLSLNGGTTSGFGSFVAVPEPTTPLLIAVAASLTMTCRRRVQG